MNKTIEEILKMLKEFKQDKIQDFLSIAKDMDLNENLTQAGLLYYSLSLNKTTLDEIKTSYPESFETISILKKLDNLNYDQQSTEAENLRKMFFAITKDI